MENTIDNRRPVTQTILKRLFKRVEISTTLSYEGTPCWIWQGASTLFDYGVVHFTVNGRLTKFPAHKLFYELFVEITPDGMVVDHLCRHTLCVNPVHTEAVTQKINVHRGISGPAENVKKTHCPQGHLLSEDNLEAWSRKKGKRACRQCKNDRANLPPQRLRPIKQEMDVHLFQQLQRTERLPTSAYLLSRIFSKIQISTENFYQGDACWEWLGCIPKSGYAQVFFQHPLIKRTPETYLAHKMMYELFVGIVPDGHKVAHLCSTRYCVNPSHLICDTSANLNKTADNAAARNARKTHCNQGHPLSGDNLVTVNRNTRRCRICSNNAQNRRYQERKLKS